MLSLFFCCLKNFDIWTILFFHDLYSCVKNFYHPLIAQFYSFMKNVSQNINFTFSHKLNFNAKVFILLWPHHLLFWRWGFREDLIFFPLLFVEWLQFVEWLSIVIWFIFSLRGFVSFCPSHDLYSHWENLYHLARRIIYIPTWVICIILLVVWFIFPLGEFVSFCLLYDLYSHLGICIILLVAWFIFSLGEFVSSYSSYDLYSRLGNLYHFAHHLIYTLIRRICIILLIVWFIFPLEEFVSFCPSHDLYSHWENLYHLAHRMIYILAWEICIICCWKDSLTLCRF